MKNIFFDLDHTLWDFEKNSQTALEIIFEELELIKHLPSFRRFHTTYRKVNGNLWKLYGKGKIEKSVLRVKRFHDTFQHFDYNDMKMAEKIAQRYVEVSPYQTNLFPHSIETLEALSKEGYRLHIITNGFKEVQHIKLEKSGLINFFDVVLCSEEVGKNKPHKDVFQEALKRAQTSSSDSIMIGDNYIADIIGAEKVGITGILFDPHKSHKFGTHEWHIQSLNQVQETIAWIKNSQLK